MNRNTDELEKRILTIGDNKLEMDSFVACGEVFIDGDYNNRTGINWNCSKDEQALYSNKLGICTDAEFLGQPLPNTIQIKTIVPEDINKLPLTIEQDGEESTFYSLLLFGRVVGEKKEILISYNCSLNKKIIFASNLKTMIDHQFIKDMVGDDSDELSEETIEDILSSNDLPY